MTLPLHYFAYGSNMNPDRFRERMGQYKSIQKATLNGVRLVFNKCAWGKSGIGYANITADPDSVVEGVLFGLMDDTHILEMDRFEGHPKHYKREIRAIYNENNESVNSWVYMASPEKVRDGLVPEKSYLDQLLSGKEFLSPEYIKKIINTARG